MAEATILRQIFKQSERRQPPTAKAATALEHNQAFRIKIKSTGKVIPFRSGTDPERAKEWVRNFYRNDLASQPHESKPNKFRITPKGAKDTDNYLEYDVAEDGSYSVVYSQVSKQNKGKGLGAGMYRQLFDEADKKGVKIHSDSRMSKESIAVWRRLKELGYPISEDFSGVTDMVGGKVDSTKPLFIYDPSLARGQ